MLLYRLRHHGYAVDPGDGVRCWLLSHPWRDPPSAWRLGEAAPAEAPLAAPVAPSKIVCVGRSYGEHARELDNPVPAEPVLFLKAPSSLIGSGEAIRLPPESGRVEHEGEIALVLGSRLGRGAGAEEARAAVLGVTAACDVTARDLQRRDPTFARAKSFDTFCPVGPAVAVGAPLDGLEVVTRVNGTERQRGRVAEMIWEPVELLRYAATMMTLEPGDLLLTGSPPGVGPLAPGDRLEVEVSGVGTLANPVEALTLRGGAG